MAAGFACMNALTIIQASQGLARFLRNKHPHISSSGVVIGHDARHNSAKFAGLAANAFIAEKIPVWAYNGPCITPAVPFGVTHLHAAAGVMVTASHNPAQDNGYKVYFQNGAQINAPIDTEIAQSIEENLAPWPGAWNELELGEYLDLDAYDRVLPEYITAVENFSKSTVLQWKSPKPFVYTPLHGVGGLVFPSICRSVGINDFTIVAKQGALDPDFPTVPFPNPEEAGSLEMATQTADREGKSLIVANDPDADRFAAAEKLDDSWFMFTGNHVGVLLASHVFDALEAQGRASDIAVLSSTVSTGMLEKMAVARGFHFQECLTGFKWMANVAQDLEREGFTVPFAFEEALGYMFPSVCYDKDGIAAAMVFLAAEARWRNQGFTIYGKLQQLFQTFGYHETLNNYFRSPNPQTTMTLFRGIRNGSYQTEQRLGSFKILRWRDVTEGYDSGTADKKSTLPVDSSSQMLTLWLDREVRFTFRASGTEPKVKVYIESCYPSRDEAVSAVCDVLLAVLREWVQPFAPTMTHSKQMSTSSGHIFTVE